MKRLIAIVGLILSVTSAALACIDPCTGTACEHYEFASTNAAVSRQPIGADGVARVPFYVNASGQAFLTEAEVIGAAKAAAATWERATPGLDLIYRGTTTTPPRLADDMFVVGFAPGSTFNTSNASGGGPDERPDIILHPSRRYAWYPCNSRAAGSCAPVQPKVLLDVPDGDPTGNVRDVYLDEDLQDDLTHLFGNALGLRPLDKQDWYAGMTMQYRRECGAAGMVCRERSTLAAGDILGIRALYPARCAPSTKARAARGSVCGVPVVRP